MTSTASIIDQTQEIAKQLAFHLQKRTIKFMQVREVQLAAMLVDAGYLTKPTDNGRQTGEAVYKEH